MPKENTPEPLLTIYTQRSCGPCHGLQMYLKARGIVFNAVDVGEDPEAAAWMRANDYSQTPVTYHHATEEHWDGFDPDRITAAQQTQQLRTAS